MAQLAIQGHSTRGKEVIEILGMLGGENPHNYSADCDSLCFYIGKGVNKIYYAWVEGCCEDEDTLVFTLEEFLEKFPYKVGDKASSKYLKNYKIVKAEWESLNNRVIYKLQGMGWYSVEELQPYKEETMEDKLEQITLDIPNGYEFFGINDDNKIVLAKIQPQYQKTYEECCEILSLGEDSRLYTKGYKASIIQNFQKLIICRDAYWKIAGDWKPDEEKNDGEYIYCISYQYDEFELSDELLGDNYILSFPTAEMRDVFYENFKELIEECKEFL